MRSYTGFAAKFSPRLGPSGNAFANPAAPKSAVAHILRLDLGTLGPGPAALPKPPVDRLPRRERFVARPA